MILANVRAQLGRDDAQLALHLIARGTRGGLESAEDRLRQEGIDALLDDPHLLGALIELPLGTRASLPLFCYVVVRHALLGVGENDRMLADYVAAILLHFGVRDRASRISPTDDERYDTLADLVGALDEPDIRRNFLIRAHLGNYALWLSGLFPDMLEYRRHRRGGPDLEYYEDLGRRGFQLAADHQLAQENGLASLFHDAAERFASLRIALNGVSDSLLFPKNHSPDRLLRQVRDGAHWRLSS
jgi:hypothetical protein